MLIKDIRDIVDARPGLSTWDFAVCCYAVELLESYLDMEGLTIWDQAEQLKDMTEKCLLNNSANWEIYSRSGNALIWEDDMAPRLYGGNVPQGINLLDAQAQALEKAADLLLKTVRQQLSASCIVHRQ